MNNLKLRNISEIRGLAHLKDLKELDLNNNLIREIEGLNSLTNLKTLNLRLNQIRNIKGLEGLTNLTDCERSPLHLSL